MYEMSKVATVIRQAGDIVDAASTDAGAGPGEWSWSWSTCDDGLAGMAVHISAAPDLPTVFFLPVAQAETRESDADVHVYVASLLAPETVVQAVHTLPFFQYPLLHVATVEFEPLVHVTVAALVTAVQVVQTLELSQDPLAQEAVQVSAAPVAPTVFFLPVAQAETRESDADVHVYVASLLASVTEVQVVHKFELSQVPEAQEAVHVSALPVPPTVFFLPSAQAETRESDADVQVYVASLLASVTAVHFVHTFELSQVPEAQEAVHVSVAPVAPTVFFLPVAQAETRESDADVHVYVASLLASVTAVH